MMKRPVTKAARHALLIGILSRSAVHSQVELARLLADEGVEVTQATLSRDLGEIGAERLRAADGNLIYAVPGEEGERIGRAEFGPVGSASPKLLRVAQELLVSVAATTNLVILRTPPGGAQFLASAIDHAEWPSVLGTVAGDDTILVVSADPLGGPALAAELFKLTERGGHDQPDRPES